MTRVVAVFFLLLSACVLGEVDLEGKACPCVSGFVCDDVSNTCRRVGAGIRDAGPRDAGPRDGGMNIEDQDGGTPDGGDAGTRDGGARDAGDAGPRDAGMRDAGAYPECQFDRDCSSPDTICVAESCAPACDRTGGATCMAPETCVDGRCLEIGRACSASKECGEGPPWATCVNGQCMAGCGSFSGACTGNRRCAADGFCRTASRCVTDRSCNHPNLICVDETCVRRCDRFGALTCRGDSVCTDGRCAGAGAIGGACLDDATCNTGYCMALASPVAETYCTRPCSATSDCPLDYTCARVSGAKQCVRESSFAPAATLDTPSGGICMATANICQSQVCRADRCVERCSVASDCAADSTDCVTTAISGGFIQECVARTGAGLGAACVSNTACASGLCNRYIDVCQAPCCSQADCGPADICTVYDLDSNTPTTVCQSPNAGAQSAPFGTPCNTALECRSELCVPTDPNNLGGPKACTTYCCTDADCDGIPSARRCATINGPIPGAQTKVCVP